MDSWQTGELVKKTSSDDYYEATSNSQVYWLVLYTHPGIQYFGASNLCPTRGKNVIWKEWFNTAHLQWVKDFDHEKLWPTICLPYRMPLLIKPIFYYSSSMHISNSENSWGQENIPVSICPSFLFFLTGMQPLGASRWMCTCSLQHWRPFCGAANHMLHTCRHLSHC